MPDKAYILDTRVAGRIYYQASDAWPLLQIGSKVELRPDFGNPYDPSAVAVWYVSEKKEYQLGFLPRNQYPILVALIDMGWCDILEATVGRLDASAPYDEQIGIIIAIKRNKE